MLVKEFLPDMSVSLLVELGVARTDDYEIV